MIQPSALETMARAAAAALPLETGGILVGHHEDDAIVVTHALAVPAASATNSRYTRDETEANRALEQLIETREMDDPAGYVGEWHSHPGSSGISSVDTRSLREVANVLNSPVALIVVFPTEGCRTAGAIAARTRSGRTLHQKALVQIVPTAGNETLH